MRRAFAACLLFLAMLPAASAVARAQERILDYHADITINADGSMDVTEHIRVHSEGIDIRHGIYRDFPTDYRDHLHNRLRVDLDVLDAGRDGMIEDWHTERRRNGWRIYLGNKDTLVPAGEHEYTLHYRTTRQLGFFDDHDELFWNVNGTGWVFPIHRISASVHLPGNVGGDKLKASGYTGATDSREQSVKVYLHDDGADYIASRALGMHENLSIVLEFPKGVVAPPGTAQKLSWLLHDNRGLLYGLAGLIVLWLYYLLAWNRHGRDPARGPLVAQYEPPDGDSAAALRYVRQMGYDNTCFTAGVLGLAVKGGLTVERNDDDEWLARRRGDDDVPSLTPPEETLHKALFAAGNELVFGQKDRARVMAANGVFKSALEQRFAGRYFNTNARYLWPGLVITVATAWLASRGGGIPTAFMLLWLAIWSCGVAALLTAAIKAAGGKGAIAMWVVAAIFSAVELGALFALGYLAGFATIPIFLALIATNIAFYFWMRAPTRLGAKLLDGIEGFRWYLGVAEKQELDARYRPEARPELFASYLPYALALGVGNAWAERFADALTPAQMQQAQPSWYVGSGSGGFSDGNIVGFSSSMSSSLGSAIASSSVAPGSSSGSSGGSGGGGGGGGGGGW